VGGTVVNLKLSSNLLLDMIAVPEERIFRYSLLSIKVDFHKTKCWAIARGPLEIIHQRPDEVSTDVNAAFSGLLHGFDVALKECDSIGVMDFSIRR
jgi:hypothetical protein